jgi:hypothetical protein
VPGDGALVDLAGVEPAGGDLARDGRGGVGDLRAAAVVDAELQGDRAVAGRTALG